jgi:hypothetical protein
VLAVVVLWSGVAVRADLIVDSFGFGNPDIHMTAVGLSNTVQTLLSEVLGGTRDATLTTTAVDGGQSELYTSSGKLQWANAPSHISTATLVYDNFTDVDLTVGGGNQYIEAIFTFIDQNTTLDITLDDGAVSFTRSLTATVGGAQTLYFNFSEYTGVDETSIDKITVKLSGEAAGDATLDLVNATGIPEPSTMALVSLGLLALARRRRS